MIDPSGVTDVFRTEWPRLVATLVRDVGDLDLAQDVAQEAFIEAANRWEQDGLPKRPGAWLLTTARRKAIDRARRSARYDERVPELTLRARSGAEAEENELVDDQLALLLGCCHPALAPEAQVALTLRVVGGLSTAQIARAFFVSEQTMTRRLTRSKSKIRDAKISFRVGDIETLMERLHPVSGVIYSIFTEGHASSKSASLVRGDLCDEATWLAELLHQLVPTDPEVSGLLALILLTDARRDARVDSSGTPILLAKQDRSLWDQHKVNRGLLLLGNAHQSRVAGTYQLQAAIAALHATAPTFDDTDWSAIVGLYDVLMTRRPSSVLALNRAVAVSNESGTTAGLQALEAIVQADDLPGDLDQYPYYHSTRAELLASLGRNEEAVQAFDSALRCCANASERIHLEQRRAELSTN